MSDTPDPEPIAPEDEPEQVRPSATGVVVPGDEDHRTGEEQAATNAANDPPA